MRPFRSSLLSWLACLLGLACQSEDKPARVQLEVAELITTTDPVPITLKLYDETGVAKVSKKKRAYQIAPQGIATVDEVGTLRCDKSGDVSVSVTVGGVEAKAAVKCRLVESIEVELADRLVIQDGPVTLAPKIVGKGGGDLSDIQVTARTKNSKAVRIKGLELTPTAVGNTTITVQAGTSKKELSTKVVRRVDFKPVLQKEGKKISYTLEPGKYEVTVKLSKPHAVETDWIGVPGCNKKTTDALHRSECTIHQKRTFLVDNPSYLESGDAEKTDGVDVYEVP